MRNKRKHLFWPAAGFLAAFIFWTLAVCFADVQPIGPQASAVGFASLNHSFHTLTGVHMVLYHITDWLSILPICFSLGFAVLGLVQWIRRRHLLRVDADILILGCFYLVVFAAYAFFESCVINYRPILINGNLEASYPSSTTLLVLCIMPTAGMQLSRRIKNRRCSRFVTAAITVFTVFMVIGRLLSGVHWLTDIIGGVLLSAGLCGLYHACITYVTTRLSAQ